jgi:tRNA A37 threonylcarbamoyladenosine dehydratase
MSHPLIARSEDLQRLVNDGYEIEIIDNHLVIRSVPYVDAERHVRRGVLMIALNLNVDVTTTPNTHVVMFAGEYPCDEHGNMLAKLRHGDSTTRLTETLVAKYSFSNKPPEGYANYYDLMTAYIAIISGPAEVIDPDAHARTWQVIESSDPDSVFVYPDTASSRAGISVVTRKLETGPIAILGLGGTGSYVLDLVAKTPVSEIHLFDGDRFGQHNAFRSPGAPSAAELKAMPFKVDHFASIYSRMRRRISPHPTYILASNLSLLEGMAFVFICMDAGDSKKAVVTKLEELSIPFIDVGMGVELSEGYNLRGIVRVTTSTNEMRDHVRQNQRISFRGDGNDVYARNIQIADLNALNAALAVIKWKKLCGFYADLDKEHFCAYTIDGNAVLNEDKS